MHHSHFDKLQYGDINNIAMERTATDLIRDDLKDYCPASNLAFNEKIRQLLNDGERIYHFGFGQAPFPVLECMVKALKENAGQNAYLNVAGKSVAYYLYMQLSLPYRSKRDIIHSKLGSATQLY